MQIYLVIIRKVNKTSTFKKQKSVQNKQTFEKAQEDTCQQVAFHEKSDRAVGSS